MATSISQARPMADWMQVLDQIESSVIRRLAQAEEAPQAEAEAGLTARSPLQILDDRLAQMQVRLDRAGRDAAEVDAALREESEAYEHWTASIAMMRQRLAKVSERPA